MFHAEVSLDVSVLNHNKDKINPEAKNLFDI